MQDAKDQIEKLEKEVADAMSFLNIPGLKEEKVGLEEQMQAPGFWDDSTKAQKVAKHHGKLEQTINDWEGFKGELYYAQELIEVLSEVEDEETFNDLKAKVAELEKKYEGLEVLLYLNGQYDGLPAIMNIHAGAGGTDAQDWGEMVLRMYMRYAEEKEWKVTLLERSDGESAGIKSASIRIEGNHTYGLLKEESGVHRLVRLSPFNSGNTRETSFARVEVIPEIENHELELDEKDLRIDVFRSSGKGGQSVNTTDSAVRITHIPTGIVVQCQNERSQLQNKQNAMKTLISKLVALKEKLQLAELGEIKGSHVENAWGNQIRSYVLHPYQMVKDHRTNHETSQVDAVLGGDVNEIDLFIEKSLKSKSKK